MRSGIFYPTLSALSIIALLNPGGGGDRDVYLEAKALSDLSF